MRRENSIVNKTLIWCLVLQVIIYQGNSMKRRDVAFTIQVTNEMYGLERPSVIYKCKSSERSLRWHHSLPKSKFSWDFEVPPFGTGLVIHKCKFLSSQGTVDLEIKTLSMTSTLCGGYVCRYVFRPNGIYFIGFETYYPHNIFLSFIELVRPVVTLVEPWNAWSPGQLKALREERSRDRAEDGKDDDDKVLPKIDDEEIDLNKEIKD